MSPRHAALGLGIVFAIAGLAGFLPGLLTPPPPEQQQMAMDAFNGMLLGLFPVNVLHSAGHLLFAIWGLAAWRSLGAARFYLRSVAVIYAILGVVGLVPGMQMLYGMAPIGGYDVWLHFLLAVFAGYAGFLATESSGERTASRHGSGT